MNLQRSFAACGVIFGALILFGCKHSICSNSSTYSFNITSFIAPDKDSLKIGDTIWFRCACPTKIQDLNSGDIIDFSTAQNLATLITVLQFKSNMKIDGALNNFNLSLVEGAKLAASSDPTSNQSYLFTEADESLSLTLAIIPKDTGRYVLSISDAPSVYRKNDICTKAAFENEFKNTNQHFYFLELWRPDLPLDALGKPKVYYFKVYSN